MTQLSLNRKSQEIYKQIPRTDEVSKITEYNINTQKSFANLWFAGDKTEPKEI